MKNLAPCALVLGFGCFAAGCAAGGQVVGDEGQSEGDEAVTATQYMALTDFDNSAYQDVWYDIDSKLNQEFASLCGDTFCEGDFANLTPLTVSCSVSSKIGTVHDCAWTFAGSAEVVDPHTAAISVDAPTFQCHFHTKTTAAKFTTLLSNSTDAIHETLPGETGSIFDTLGECFQHPIGGVAITPPNETGATYIEASDYYKTAANQAKWSNAKAALNLGFNNVCGDTFCESDYADLQSLAFVCSVTKSSGNVKGCAWVFGGSYSLVGAKGEVDETSNSFNCPVPVKGTLSQLITTLTAAGTTDAIDRPLPGTTASAYDAIGGCLP